VVLQNRVRKDQVVVVVVVMMVVVDTVSPSTSSGARLLAGPDALERLQVHIVAEALAHALG
jgi:hypothetical protein